MTVEVDPGTKQCLNDYSEIVGFVSIEEKVLKKNHLISADKARESSDKPVAVVVGLNDPVGEVQDRFYEYEYVCKRHYARNKPLFDTIREAIRERITEL